MQKANQSIKYFNVNDKGMTVYIKQHNINELSSLYHVLLQNIGKTVNNFTKTYYDKKRIYKN